jgi:hypothetical protein
LRAREAARAVLNDLASTMQHSDHAHATGTLVEEGIVAVIEALSQLTDHLTDQLTEPPEIPTLRRQAESYARIVRQWSRIPPSPEQRRAMLGLIAALQSDVMTLRRRSA